MGEESKSTSRDWYDKLSLVFSALQTTAIVGGIFFAISEFRDRGATARDQRNKESLTYIDKIETSEGSLRNDLDAFSADGPKDTNNVPRIHKVVSVRRDKEVFKGFPVLVEISNTPDQAKLSSILSDKLTSLLAKSKDYNTSIDRYVECIDADICNKDTSREKVCGSMSRYVNAIRSYFTVMNVAENNEYYVPEDFQDFKELADPQMLSELIKSGKVYDGNVDPSGDFVFDPDTHPAMERLATRPPFSNLSNFVFQFDRLCEAKLKPDDLFQGMSSSGF
jgi:hypothetical protein